MPSVALPTTLPAPQASEALLRLAVAAARDDVDHGVHHVRLGYLAEALARHLGVDAARARLLRQAAPLRDIGLNPPPGRHAGPPTPAERAQQQAHPRQGAALLAGTAMPLFTLAAEVALHHHERWDGHGFPQGLSGTDIPLSARIVAVVEHFDALTLDHPYRPATADDRALAMLAAQAGRAFDPRVVATLQAHAGELIALRDWVNDTRPGFGAPVPGSAPLPANGRDLLGGPPGAPE